MSFDRAIAFVPAVNAELYPRPNVRYLPVEDLPPCTFGLAWPASAEGRPQIALLEEVCRRLRERGIPQGMMKIRTAPRRPAHQVLPLRQRADGSASG